MGRSGGAEVRAFASHEPQLYEAPLRPCPHIALCVVPVTTGFVLGIARIGGHAGEGIFPRAKEVTASTARHGIGRTPDPNQKKPPSSSCDSGPAVAEHLEGREDCESAAA